MSENRPFNEWTPGFKASDVPIASPGAGNFQDLPPEVFGIVAQFGLTPPAAFDAEFVEDEPIEPTGTCAQCGLNPPDGRERARSLDDGGVLWLHPGCEGGYQCRRLVEEGIASPAGPAKPTKLIPDREVLVAFVDIIFRNARRDGFVSFRVFKDDGNKDKKALLISAVRLDDPEFVELMMIAAEQAANWDEPAVFAPPVATFKDHRNAKADNLLEGIDISCECDEAPAAARTTLEALLGPATIVIESGGEWTDPETGEVEPKLHLHWRLKVPATSEEEHALLYEARELVTQLGGGDPTNKPVCHPIRWPGSWHRKNTPKLAKIVAVCENEVDLADAPEALRKVAGVTEPRGGSGDNGPVTAGKVAMVVAVIPNDDLHWGEWSRIGMAIWASTQGSDEGRATFHEWSAKSKKYNKTTTDKRWKEFTRSPPTKIGFGTLVYLAKQHDPDFRGWDDDGRGKGMFDHLLSRGEQEDEANTATETKSAIAVLDSINPGDNVDWTKPEGLLGTIADWIMLTSRRPNRPMAVASALAILSAVCGRWLYGPTGTALLVYIVILARTAMGKDRPLAAPAAILAAANLHRLHTTAKGFSVGALEQMMIDHPCCVATVDEIGASLFARMSHKHSSTHEQGMVGTLLELWSRDQFKGPFSTTRHAKQKDMPQVPGCVSVPYPNLTLFGASTPEAFYASVSAGSVKNGFLNRFLTCEAGKRGKAQEVSEADGKVPEAIVKAINELVPDLYPFGNIAGVLGPYALDSDVDPIVRRLPWDSDDVLERAQKLEEQILVAIDADPENGPLLGRVFEYSVRLASLHAVSRAGVDATVTMADFSWGTSWAIQSAKAMVESVAGLMASSEYETKFNTVRNVIKDAGQLARRELLRQVRSISARERDDIINHLIGGGWIEEVKITTKGRTAIGWKWL